MANKEDSRLNNDLKNNYEILKTLSIKNYIFIKPIYINFQIVKKI